MDTFLVTLLVFGIAVIAMAVGVLLSNRPIKGSCGGLSALSDRTGQQLCDICGGDPDKQPSDCSDRQSREPHTTR